MSFVDLFQAFSRRQKGTQPPRKKLTPEFRNRVFLRCRDVFGSSGYGPAFWNEIHAKLSYLHGSPLLSEAGRRGELIGNADTIAFLNGCADEHFMDFVELIFRVDVVYRVRARETLVDDFNEFLRVDDLPYSVTPWVWKHTTTDGKVLSDSTSGLRGGATSIIIGVPEVIRKDSELIFSSAVQPALVLLRDARFTSSNEEFLAALKDYRHGDFGDCITKCCSALESTLKIVCQEKGWPHKATDTAAPLLKTVLSNTNLEPFWEQPLTLIATLRNRVSTAHGAGANARDATEAKAEYAINATASAILFLIRVAM